jgi:hypothetical protein
MTWALDLVNRPEIARVRRVIRSGDNPSGRRSERERSRDVVERPAHPRAATVGFVDMHSDTLAPAFEATVVVSTLASAGLLLLSLSGARDSREREGRPPSRVTRAIALAAHPLAQLLFVCAALLVNQVLFDAYVLRVHGGDASFVSRYVGWGWFAIAKNDSVVRFVAGHVGDGRWLSPTVLRVQAFLELPFAIFAYVTVARMLGAGVVRRLTRAPVVVAACVSFTITFCLVEISVPNPWTSDDLVVRWISAAVTPAWTLLVSKARARVEAADDGPRGVLGLVAFLAGAGAIAYVVLALYDAFLLYNLAHLARYARGLSVAIAIAAGASWAAPRVDRVVARWLGWSGTAPSVDVAVSALASFTVVFFVPSLSIRYWGQHATAFACGTLLFAIGAVLGLFGGLRRAPTAVAKLRAVASTAAGLAAGTHAAASALESRSVAGLPELMLAKASLAFLAASVLVMRACEVVLGGGPSKAVCSPSDEEEAQVDEA